MAKEIGVVHVLNVESITTKDGALMYRCVGMTEEQEVCVFYRQASDGEPKPKDRFMMYLGFDAKLKAVVRYGKI